MAEPAIVFQCHACGRAEALPLDTLQLVGPIPWLDADGWKALRAAPHLILCASCWSENPRCRSVPGRDGARTSEERVMAAGPCTSSGSIRRSRGRNYGRGPGNIAGIPRGHKVVSRSKRMALKKKAKA